MRFSVVVPTYRRREVVVRTVAALDRQELRDFEVIVVVDGSDDGSAAALRALDTGFPLQVVEQDNRGAAEARNAGATRSRGEALLFLDDDMAADPSLLAEHDCTLRDGADLVLGHVALDPRSPRNLLSLGVGIWAEGRRERLTDGGGELRLDDLLTGQMSVARERFESLGGFDAGFTRDGLFGGEDIDFGYRVLRSGLRAVFNPRAVSYQYYDVGPALYLRRSREAGRSDEELVMKHPELAGRLRRPELQPRKSRWLLEPLVAAPAPLSWPLRAAAAALVRSGLRGQRARRLFFAVRTMEYRRGARRVRRRSSGRAVVLAYHAIADLAHDPVLRRYAVPPALFADQLDALRGAGRSFVGLDAVLAALAGGPPLPAGAMLVTFDDAYTDLLEAACPLLAERGIPALAFAVAGLVGQSNAWDRDIGAGRLELLDPEGLREISTLGVEVGSHGSTHRSLVGLAPATLTEEVHESAKTLERLGVDCPRAFSYPYGEHDSASVAAVREAGYRVAFTISPGVVSRDADLHALPRVEVLGGDTPARLRLKLATAAWPARLRRPLLRLAGTR